MRSLHSYRDAELSLDELCQAAAAHLGSDAAQADARIQLVPDARTVRYYQTLGVLDRPKRYDGRQAIYVMRHLLQLIAIKRLQARDLSLAQIQNALHGRSDAELESAVMGDEPTVPSPGPARRTARESKTWLAEEVAQGVVVSIDPSAVPDPHALLRRIRALLSTGGRS